MNDIPGELAFDSSNWKIYRQDAGMGEKEYRLFKDGKYFCLADDYDRAKEIMIAVIHYRATIKGMS